MIGADVKWNPKIETSRAKELYCLIDDPIPSIDPLSDKNKELPKNVIDEVLNKYKRNRTCQRKIILIGQKKN